MKEQEQRILGELNPWIPIINDDKLQLSTIKLNEDYRKEWNERLDDFVVLTRNGKLVNNSLYRVGGIGGKPDGENYFMLLKHVEAYYSAEIMKNSKSKDPKHLSSKWCIIDKNGVEKVVFDNYKSPWLIKNSCIYVLDNNYYNIETGQLYCNSLKCVESADFLFIENNYDKDVSKRGVMKINKKTGISELYK